MLRRIQISGRRKIINVYYSLSPFREFRESNEFILQLFRRSPTHRASPAVRCCLEWFICSWRGWTIDLYQSQPRDKTESNFFHEDNCFSPSPAARPYDDTDSARSVSTCGKWRTPIHPEVIPLLHRTGLHFLALGSPGRFVCECFARPRRRTGGYLFPYLCTYFVKIAPRILPTFPPFPLHYVKLPVTVTSFFFFFFFWSAALSVWPFRMGQILGSHFPMKGPIFFSRNIRAFGR